MQQVDARGLSFPNDAVTLNLQDKTVSVKVVLTNERFGSFTGKMFEFVRGAGQQVATVHEGKWDGQSNTMVFGLDPSRANHSYHFLIYRWTLDSKSQGHLCPYIVETSYRFYITSLMWNPPIAINKVTRTASDPVWIDWATGAHGQGRPVLDVQSVLL